MRYPVVLSIAGSDSSGGAGIQADIKTVSAIGAYAATAITSVTAQNTLGVTAIQGIDPSVVAKQIDAVFTDIRPQAVKIGMLFSKSIVEAVAERLAFHSAEHVVLDPVMVSSSGSALINGDAIDALRNKLIPLAEIVTPNKEEAGQLADITIDNPTSIRFVARRIILYGCKSVLIKGGHFSGKTMTDYFFTSDEQERRFSGRFIDTPNTHGTGCTLSSAIATYLALGQPLEAAVKNAKKYLQTALERGAAITAGAGHGPLNHLFNPKKIQTI